jgi:hypothetical protein
LAKLYPVLFRDSNLVALGKNTALNFDGRKPTSWQEKQREKRQERLEEIKRELGGLLRRPAG